MGKKDKKNKKKNEKQKVNLPKEDDNTDVKEVLQLFNKLEELVVDGDPRIREALNQKPGLQTLLRDDSSIYGFSPRTMNVPMQQDHEMLVKESTNTSLNSRRQLMLTHPSPRGVTMQTQTTSRSPRRNIIVPPITIPEHSTLGDTFSDGYFAARIKQHPDGTLESTRVENPIVPETIKRPQNIAPRQIQQPRYVFDQPVPQLPQVINRPVNRQPPKTQKPERITPPEFHSFIYDTAEGQNTVQIQLLETNRKQKDITKRSKSPTLPLDAVDKVDMDDELQVEDLVVPEMPIQQTYHVATAAKQQTLAVYSKVIGEEGGGLHFFGCRIEIPKNAVEGKGLFRVSILDISQVPHKTDRIFQRSINDSVPVVMAISPAIHISPINARILKPITVQLPTCVAIHTQTEEEEQLAEEHSDIKADNIIVQQRNKNTKDVWNETDTDVFRSSDSVIFKLQELGDVCAFYQSAEATETLNKRVAVFLFKSCDNRKNQFVSILITEDLPHVTQKGIEYMPQWLKYMDSCSNILMPEGRNLVIYIEAIDRTSCTVDANKIDIPWENLWYPECIIRKHIRVKMLKMDTPTTVQVYIDDGRTKLNSEFMWKVKRHSILMPDLMTTGEEHEFLPTEDKWENEEAEKARLEQEMLKKVTWKPETPAPRFVTNKSLLNYAVMH